MNTSLALDLDDESAFPNMKSDTLSNTYEIHLRNNPSNQTNNAENIIYRYVIQTETPVDKII